MWQGLNAKWPRGIIEDSGGRRRAYASTSNTVSYDNQEKSIHEFPSLSYMSLGFRSVALRAAGAPLKNDEFFRYRSSRTHNLSLSRRSSTPWRLIAELRRPVGPPSGVSYSCSKAMETHELFFLMVIMASGIARGRVRLTTTTTTAAKSRRLAAILQLIG